MSESSRAEALAWIQRQIDAGKLCPECGRPLRLLDTAPGEYAPELACTSLDECGWSQLAPSDPDHWIDVSWQDEGPWDREDDE